MRGQLIKRKKFLVKRVILFIITILYFMAGMIIFHSCYNKNYPTIAVIDTGVDIKAISSRHRNNILDGLCTIDSTTVDKDINGHGTDMIRIIFDVNQNVLVLPIKAIDKSGYVDPLMIVKAINIAIEESVDVINISSGMRGYNSLIDEALTEAKTNGIIIVASAGNDGTNDIVDYPSRDNGIISVGAKNTMHHQRNISNAGKGLDLIVDNRAFISKDIWDASWQNQSSASTAIISAVITKYLVRYEKMDAVLAIFFESLSTREVLEWSSERGYGELLSNNLSPSIDEKNIINNYELQVGKLLYYNTSEQLNFVFKGEGSVTEVLINILGNYKIEIISKKKGIPIISRACYGAENILFESNTDAEYMLQINTNVKQVGKILIDTVVEVDKLEPNDNIDNISSITLGILKDLTFHNDTDEDWFEIIKPVGMDQIVLKVTSLSPEIDTIIMLDYNTSIYDNVGYEATEVIELDIKDTNIIFSVSNYYGIGSYGTYSIEVCEKN